MSSIFGSGAQPPAPLASAIEQASSNYGVPEDLLAGIWRRESGGHYPNAFVNSAGYGGLFGTHNWDAPTQVQADTAAGVLATGIRDAGGQVAGGLSYYNSGKLTGGYTSVPGETTFGTIPIPGASGGIAQTGPGLQGPVGPGGNPLDPSVGGTAPATSTSSSSSSSSDGTIVGSLKEAAVRLLEVLAGLALMYLAFRQLGTAFGGGRI